MADRSPKDAYGVRVQARPSIQLSLLAPPSLPEPEKVREGKGVVYTKRWVVELMLDLAGYVSSANLVDAVAVEPAAGKGAFLGAMIERLVDSCERQVRPLEDCERALVAYEVAEGAAAEARSTASGILVRRGVAPRLAERLASRWVRTGDYLLESAAVEADFVAGNPPYVRIEDFPEQLAAVYRQSYRTMQGRADLYVAFFQAALHQLRPGGVCAFICADRWMRNQYGAELRRLVTGGFSVEHVLEMHDADAFHEEVSAYPAVTIIRRQRQEAVVVASAGGGVEQAASSQIAAALQAVRRGVPCTLPEGVHATRVERWFEGREPWPCGSPKCISLLRRLEEAFPALEAHAKVGIGVATGNDRVFITREPGLVEPSRLLKLAMASDAADGVLRWSGNYLVDPWDSDGLVKLERYPRLRTYLEAHRDALERRHTAAGNAHAWYKTIDRVNHALTAQPKLYIPDIKDRLSPVLDAGETYPHHNLYFIQSAVWDLEVLGGLLLSTVGQLFLAAYGVRMRGGYLRFQAQYLRRVRTPDPHALGAALSRELVQAFRTGDRERATAVALEAYGVRAQEMEHALGR